MNVECFDADACQPAATLPGALSEATFDGAPLLVKGNEPGEVVILIETDQFSS